MPSSWKIQFVQKVWRNYVLEIFSSETSFEVCPKIFIQLLFSQKFRGRHTFPKGCRENKVFHLFVAIAASWDKRSPGAAEQYKSNGKSIIYHRDLLDINLAMKLHLLHLDTPHFCEWWNWNERRYITWYGVPSNDHRPLSRSLPPLLLCCRCKFFYHRADTV